MELTAIASFVAATAALIGAAAQLLRPAGDFAWYKRWIEAREHTRTQAERELVDRRISYYVVELAVTDSTRKKRAFSTGLGLLFFAIGVGIAFSTSSKLAGVVLPSYEAFLVVMFSILVAFGIGFFFLFIFPARIRRKKRNAINASMGSESSGIAERNTPAT